jgi:PAS domain S-box-containing protein
MPEIPLKNNWRVASTGTFVFLLVIIFVTELAVMGSPLLSRFDRVSAALVDAGILVAVFSLPLMLFCLRLRSQELGPKSALWGLYFRVLVIIFIIESSVMFLMPAGKFGSKNLSVGVIDALLTLSLSAPPLWLMFRRLERRYRKVPLADYLNNPPMLYMMLLLMVFFADLQQEVLLPILFNDLNSFFHKIANAVMTTLFIAPILWLLVARPLRRSALSEQARTRAVYAQVVDAVITFDGQGLVECFNPGAQRIFGYSADEMAGQHAAQLFDEGRDALNRLVKEAAANTAEQTRVPGYELLGSRSDGTSVTMDVSISKIQQLGKAEFLLIMRDITERREAGEALQASEIRFRQLFEQSDDAIFFLNAHNFAVIDINSVMANMFGYSRVELSEKGLAVLFGDEDYQRVRQLLGRVKQGESLQLDKLGSRHKDGREIVTSLRAKATELREGEIIYCTFRDVTERVRMEAEAKEIQSKLIQANKMTALGLMVSGVAHEINNPNNFILSNSRLLEGSWQDALKILKEYYQENGDFLLGGIPFSRLESQSRQLFAGIVDGSRRINEIVSNLKGFARQESVALDSEVDINQVANAAVSILHHEIVRLTERFRFEPAAVLPRVKGNRQQLGQVVVNLLMNACQALTDKTRAVVLRTYFNPEASEVVVAVHDEGSGMSAEAAKLIMEPFFTTKLDSGGTGLGLTICRTIIREHNGTIDFSSEPGRGTTFFIRLPVPEADTEDANL